MKNKDIKNNIIYYMIVNLKTHVEFLQMERFQELNLKRSSINLILIL